MKIATEHIGRLLEARLERVHWAAEPPRPAAPGPPARDRATFSSRAEEVRLALAAAKRPQPADDPRLDALAARLRTGRYRVGTREVAEAVLRDLKGPEFPGRA